MHAKKVEEFRIRLGFDCCLGVDRVGRGGGVAMFWKNSYVCSVMSYSANFVNLEVCDPKKGRWRLTGFYGLLHGGSRRESWEMLKRLHGLSPLP